MRCLTGIILLFIFTSCCKNKSCEYITQGMTIHYESQNSACPEDLYLYEFRENDNQLLSENEEPIYIDCSILIEYKPDRYWIIQSQNSNITDTINILSIDLDDDPQKLRCCDCGQIIKEIEFEIGDSTYKNTEVKRFF